MNPKKLAVLSSIYNAVRDEDAVEIALIIPA
jgi:hypothetical protein